MWKPGRYEQALMKKRLTLKAWTVLVTAAMLATLGIVYALEISRPVAGSVMIGQVQTVDETLLVYSQITPSTADLSELDFGVVDINAFGLFNKPGTIPLWVGNGGEVPFEISLVTADLAVNGTLVTGDMLTLLLGPPEGVLLPSPDHATMINPGKVVSFEAGLVFLDAPDALGIGPGDRITFTALFRADSLQPAPTPTPTSTPTPTPGPSLHDVDALSLPLRYEPQEITIRSGDRVSWTAGAGDPHTATSGLPFQPDGLWDTGLFFPEETSTLVLFDTVGTFPYWCQIHPEDMAGTIVVVP